MIFVEEGDKNSDVFTFFILRRVKKRKDVESASFPSVHDLFYTHGVEPPTLWKVCLCQCTSLDSRFFSFLVHHLKHRPCEENYHVAGIQWMQKNIFFHPIK
jgi:hypothetical protein